MIPNKVENFIISDCSEIYFIIFNFQVLTAKDKNKYMNCTHNLAKGSKYT